MTAAEGRPQVTITDITAFLAAERGLPISQVQADSDICVDLGCDGDDFGEMMRDFAAKFQVDLTGYRWQFHHGPEGFALFSLFSRSVPHIPVTPSILTEAANSGRWMLTYPEVDDVRDLRLRTFLTAFVIVAVLVFALSAALSLMK